jgi:hypothetical protein
MGNAIEEGTLLLDSHVADFLAVKILAFGSSDGVDVLRLRVVVDGPAVVGFRILANELFDRVIAVAFLDILPLGGAAGFVTFKHHVAVVVEIHDTLVRVLSGLQRFILGSDRVGALFTAGKFKFEVAWIVIAPGCRPVLRR